MRADEAKSNGAEIELVAETTSPVMEIPSEDDKFFAEWKGGIVALTSDQTCVFLDIVKEFPRACSIRQLCREEAHNLGRVELPLFDEKVWLFSPSDGIEEAIKLVLKKRRYTLEPGYTPLEVKIGYVCDAREIKEEIGIEVKTFHEPNQRTNRLPTVSRKDLKRAKLEKKALKRMLRESICSILAEMFPSANRETTNNLLPVSSKDSNIKLGQKVLTFKAFLGSALHVPTQQRIGILVLLFSLLQYVTPNSTDTMPFESQFSGKLSFGEAIFALTPEITRATLFIISYIMSWTLVLPLQPAGLLILLAILLTYAPFLFLPYLVRHSSASGIHVACRGFNLSVIGFTGVVTSAFCLFFAAVVLIVLYAIWCFMYRMKPPSGQDSEVTEDLLSMMSEELNANDSV